MRSTVLLDTLRCANSWTARIAVIMAECARSNAKGWSRTNATTARRRVSSFQQESSWRF